jgi:2-polyprenyl-3-methyl-5-hydroxy-6-metoxy-1,4-benzoquinol methylase
MTQENFEKDNYFNLRGVGNFKDEDTTFPFYLQSILPSNKSIKICDIGCGYGRLLIGLRTRGYIHLHGVDQNLSAVEWCRKSGFTVTQMEINDFVNQEHIDRQDFVIMSHVLEHLYKDSIISVLTKIKKNILVPGGSIIIMVPNAQSATGCYWAYEDFTHSTLFTAGSLGYVLRAAGFQTIEFIDPYCTAGLSKSRAIARKLLLSLYKGRISFWNKVTGSSFHKASPTIYSFEIKVKAS